MSDRGFAGLRVHITGASPDAVNLNSSLRQAVAEGFETLLGPGQVGISNCAMAVEHIEEFRPDLVVVFGSCLPNDCDYAPLRNACDRAGSCLVFWLHDDPYEFDAHRKILPYADHIFTNDRWTARYYGHPRVGHLPLAASPTFHSARLPAEGDRFQRDVFFCGVGYANRRQLVLDLARCLASVKTEIYGADWNVQATPFCSNRRLDNDNLPQWYASSRVVLNLPRDHDLANRHAIVASTPGPRTFEAAMAGAVQMFFANSLEILDYFEPSQEILLFDDPGNFEHQLCQLLAEPERIERIGQAARARCLAEHTYAARAKVLLERVGFGAPAKISAASNDAHCVANS